jgi:hypothetical protein
VARLSTREFIRLLNPEKDYRRINYLLTCYEFPFDMARALELALFRTFAAPSGASILDSTGEFACRAQKRYDDTDIILNEMLEHGLENPRGKTALRRMNTMHGHYDIPNEDFLYVLSTFVLEPIRWIDKYGWRRLTEQEKQAIFHYWVNMARHMNIRNVPETIEELEWYNVEFERKNFQYSEPTRRTAQAGLDMFLHWVPFFARPAARWVLYATMDEPLLLACGFPIPAGWLRKSVEASLKGRALAARYLPRRKKPRLRTGFHHRIYPHGYDLEQVGAQEPSPDNPHLKKRHLYGHAHNMVEHLRETSEIAAHS